MIKKKGVDNHFDGKSGFFYIQRENGGLLELEIFLEKTRVENVKAIELPRRQCALSMSLQLSNFQYPVLLHYRILWYLSPASSHELISPDHPTQMQHTFHA
jgi:hypothetical protein